MMGGWLFWPFGLALAGATAIIAIVLVIFWILMIIDCARRDFKNDVEKIIWILVIVFMQWIGALVYLLVVRMSNPKGLMKK